MKRPAFQFYPADWRNNAKLRRCSFAERGVWIDVICLLHDSDEYGVLRWPLKEIAMAVGCKLADIKALVAKQVFKGGDATVEPLVYVPRHAGKDGEPVTLIAAQAGPVWYSSRMVRDEYIRSKRGESTRFESPNGKPKPPNGEAPKAAPIHREGYGASSASSASSSINQNLKQVRAARSTCAQGFAEFWIRYPNKVDKLDAERCWNKLNPDEILVSEILAALEAQKGSRAWSDAQFIPGPAKWIRKQRWNDVVPRETAPMAKQDQAVAKWLEVSGQPAIER